MQTDYLLKNMVKYDQTDVNITGNPQITYFLKDLKQLNYKRHTNFQYGMINLCEIDGAYKTELDIINHVIIITDNINSIQRVTFVTSYTNSIASVSIDTLKMFDIAVRKIFFKIGNKYMIKIHLANIFNFVNNYNFFSTEFINLSVPKLKIHVARSSNDESPIELKIYGCLLDSEERKRLAWNLNTTHCCRPIINLSIEYTDNEEQTMLEYDLHNYLFIKTQSIIIKTLSLDDINNIVLRINNTNIMFSLSMLKMYNDVYNTIIFKCDNHWLLKIPYLIATDVQASLFKITLNLDKPTETSIHLTTDVEYKINEFRPLVAYTEKFNTYVQHYQIMSNDEHFVNLNIDQINLKEIIIICTKNEIQYKPITKFLFDFDGSSAIYTSADCEIYQTLHHNIINPNAYTVGFALEPDNHYSTGCVNYKKLKFNYDTSDTDFTINIYLIGFKHIA